MRTKTERPSDLPERLSLSEHPNDRKRLWWQAEGLTQTASGYGGKLTTERRIYWRGRWRRVYCALFSNAGTCYIVVKGHWIFIED